VDAVLIGLDGGATELKAHHVVPLYAGLYELGSAAESRLWSAHPGSSGFTPEPLAAQRARAVPTHAELSAVEQRAGTAWIELTVDAIVALARAVDTRCVEIGACFPGLKTRDARGIAVSRNGPRIPDFAARLEDGVRGAGLALAAPIAALHSDGHCCGVGEQHAVSGAFRSVPHAYYLGGGTGLPEALKLAGVVRSFDELRGKLRKAWELEIAPGRSFEDELAPSALNRRWRAGASAAEAGPWIEQAAERGEPRAAEWLAVAGAWLAALCFERLARCASGAVSDGVPIVLERIVIGQRLGQVWASEGGAALRASAHEHLGEMLRGAAAPELQQVWLDRGALTPERLVASRLRAAPALGAAVLAREPLGA
jgi:hypothetical protein